MTVTIAMEHLREAIEIVKRVQQGKERDEVLAKLEAALQEITEVWRKI
jgi:hypothetical protein